MKDFYRGPLVGDASFLQLYPGKAQLVLYEAVGRRDCSLDYFFFFFFFYRKAARTNVGRQSGGGERLYTLADL